VHTMYYADEIRQVDEFRTNTDLVKPNELAMANMPIETLKAEFEPEKYHQTYRDNLMATIEAKNGRAAGGTDAGAARGAGDRHHGSAEAQPGGEEEAGAGGYGGRRRRLSLLYPNMPARPLAARTQISQGTTTSITAFEKGTFRAATDIPTATSRIDQMVKRSIEVARL